jgi:HEAT repeat protein
MTGTNGLEKEEIKDIKQIQMMLKSNESEKRFQAILLLLQNDFPETNDILQSVVLNDTQVSVRELALISLINLNPHNIMFTLKKLYNNLTETKEIRARTIWGLSQIKTEEAFEFLKIALTDKTEEVLYWAIVGSTSFESFPEVLPEIRKLLADSRQSLIRQTAAWILGACRDVGAKDILEKQLLQDTHPSVRLLCASALIKLDDISSISILCKALQKDANELPRREIAYAIGVILDFQKTGSQILENHKLQDIRTHAVRSLLKALLRDQSYIVRRICAVSLGKIKDKSAVKNLISAMSMDTNQFVRCEIARTLGILGDASAIEILKKASRSQYRRIVEAANEALQQIQ